MSVMMKFESADVRLSNVPSEVLVFKWKSESRKMWVVHALASTLTGLHNQEVKQELKRGGRRLRSRQIYAALVYLTGC